MTTIKAIASDGRTRTALTKRHTIEMATERVYPLAGEREGERKTKQIYIFIHARRNKLCACSMYYVAPSSVCPSRTYTVVVVLAYFYYYYFCVACISYLLARIPHSIVNNSIKSFTEYRNVVHKYIVSDTHVAHTTGLLLLSIRREEERAIKN